MNRTILVTFVGSTLLLAATHLSAQAPATQNPPPTPPKPAEANPFPEDTNNVPVMPSHDTPALPPGTSNGAENIHVPLPSADLDPVRSPDDRMPDAGSASDSGSSDSNSGLDRIIPGGDDDTQTQGRHRKMAVPPPEHHETSAEDIEVGKYELDRKNWKAALSRFESAMVLAPDEPEVYWGLAESERHLGNFAAARGYYQKVAEYDPDSRHGKEAMKALKDPEIANAKATPPPSPAPPPTQ